MESAISCKEGRECLHSRAHSQPSSTIHRTMTTKSTTISSSHSRVAAPSYVPLTHGCRQSHCDRETACVRQMLRLPLEPSRESDPSMIPMSSLLQEKLQQERRAESERLSSNLGTDLASSTGHIRGGDGLVSSHRRIRSVAERRSTSSNGDDSSQSSMGVKRMEQAVSTLHNQNFDLKLELFHRRNKQSALEARVEELEAERLEWLSTRDDLLADMQKRDKAIAEAVNMIVKLEARADQLVQEREMLQRITADGSHQVTWHAVSDSLHGGAPKQGGHGEFLSAEPNKTLERMPSFLTERSVHTENLRNIVLQSNSGPKHLRKISQISSSSVDVSEINRVASPSLSILSESSFVSIYGPKQGQDGTGFSPNEDASGTDDTLVDRSPTPTKKTFVNSLSDRDATISSRMGGTTPRAAANQSGQAMPLNHVVHHVPHFSRIERPSEQLDTIEETFNSSMSKWGRPVVTPTSQLLKSPSKREKRERVSTSHSTDNTELGYIHTLPPTPDTVSSSILQQHKDSTNSQDSLSRSNNNLHVLRLLSGPPPGTEHLASLIRREARLSMPVPMTSSRYSSELSATDDPLKTERSRSPPSDLHRLDRSTGESDLTTWLRSDSYISDSDSDGGADAHSDAPSVDYWMRESLKPDSNSTSSDNRMRRRSSPSHDLFSFPVESGEWEPDAMFGALKGNGFLGSPVDALKRDPMDEMASSEPLSQSDPLPPADGPRLPSRRSSLHAQNTQNTDHAILLSQTEGALGGTPRYGTDIRAEARSSDNSIDGYGLVTPSGTRPDAGSITKRSQYPPISGLQSRGRALVLNSFLRRSGSESHGARSHTPEPAVLPSVLHRRSSPTPQSQAQTLKRRSGVASVPPPVSMPWPVRPMPSAENKSERATPPPILRNRPPRVRTDLAGPSITTSATTPAIGAGARTVSPSASETTPVVPHGGGGMRKWLSLGKRSSLISRAR